MAEAGDEGAGSATRGDDAATAAPEDDDGGRRSLIVGAVLTAFRSESWLLRSYGLVSLLLGAFVALLVALAFPQWVQTTLDRSAPQSFSGAFLLLSGLLVIAGLFAPLLYAHRHHREGGATRVSDFFLAATGYGFAGSLYVSLLISAPPALRESPPAAVAPVVEFLYGLDPVVAVVPPVLAAALIAVAGNADHLRE